MRTEKRRERGTKRERERERMEKIREKKYSVERKFFDDTIIGSSHNRV